MLQATTLDITRVINDIPSIYRATPVIVGIRGRKNILAVKSEHGSWHLPQGGVEKGESVSMTVYRELKQELGIAHEDVYMRSASIFGITVNQIPKERKIRDRDQRDKVLIFVAVPISNSATITLNGENTRWTSVRDPYHLWNLMKGARDVKFSATCEALKKASTLGMLCWDWNPIQIPLSTSN